MIARASVLWYTADVEVSPAFIDETGLLGGPAHKQPVYGVGVSILREPPAVTDQFYRLHFNFASVRAGQRSRLKREIRTGERAPTLDELNLLMRDTRHHEYKFSEVTRSNLQQYIDLLRLYLSTRGSSSTPFSLIGLTRNSAWTFGTAIHGVLMCSW